MKSRKFCGICLAQYNLSVIKSLIWFSSTKSTQSSESLQMQFFRVVSSIHFSTLSHDTQTKSGLSFLWPQYTQMSKKRTKSIHSPVAETKHNPLTCIACSGKLCIKKYNTVKLGAEHTCYYAAQRAMPERQGAREAGCQRGRERNVYSHWLAAGVSGIPLLLTKEQETGQLAQPWLAF